MSDEAKAALIALVGVLFSTLLSLFVSKKTIQYSYKDLFAKTVSQSRNRWLNEMRSFISSMLAEVKNPSNKQKSNKTDRTNAYWKARNQILLRLKLNEPLHIMLAKEIYDLDLPSADIDDISNKIIEISQHLLKEEWEKVKKEAKGE